MKLGLLLIIRMETKFQIGKFTGALKISQITAISILAALCIMLYLLVSYNEMDSIITITKQNQGNVAMETEGHGG